MAIRNEIRKKLYEKDADEQALKEAAKQKKRRKQIAMQRMRKQLSRAFLGTVASKVEEIEKQ